MTARTIKSVCVKAAAIAVAAVAASASLTANATVINLAAYDHSFTITFPGYSGSETLTDFPVLVKVSAVRNNFRPEDHLQVSVRNVANVKVLPIPIPNFQLATLVIGNGNTGNIGNIRHQSCESGLKQRPKTEGSCSRQP